MTLKELLREIPTHADLARHLGVSRALISHFKAGRRVPPPQMAKKIAEFTGTKVDAEKLLDGELVFVRPQ